MAFLILQNVQTNDQDVSFRPTWALSDAARAPRQLPEFQELESRVTLNRFMLESRTAIEAWYSH